MKKLIVLGLLAIFSLSITGCGQTAPNDAKRVLTQYLEAERKHDYKIQADLLNPQMYKAIAESNNKSIKAAKDETAQFLKATSTGDVLAFEIVEWKKISKNLYTAKVKGKIKQNDKTFDGSKIFVVVQVDNKWYINYSESPRGID